MLNSVTFTGCNICLCLGKTSGYVSNDVNNMSGGGTSASTTTSLNDQTDSKSNRKAGKELCLKLARNRSAQYYRTCKPGYICYLPARRSVLEKTVPEVLNTARGRRPRAVPRPRAQFS